MSREHLPQGARHPPPLSGGGLQRPRMASQPAEGCPVPWDMLPAPPSSPLQGTSPHAHGRPLPAWPEAGEAGPGVSRQSGLCRGTHQPRGRGGQVGRRVALQTGQHGQPPWLWGGRAVGTWPGWQRPSPADPCGSMQN